MHFPQSISSLVSTLVDDDRESQNLISNYRTCAIKGRSRLVASPLRFQAKNDFLLHFYVIIQRVLGLTWRHRQMSFFVDQKPEEISKNDGNTI